MKLETILETQRPVMIAQAFKVLGNLGDAEDCVQIASVKAHKSWNSFRGTCEITTWLYRIVTNTAINIIRSRKKDDILDHIDSVPDAMSTVDVRREVDLYQLRADIAEAMTKLSKPHQAVVTLTLLEGIASGEAGLRLGIPERTVRTQLHYARKQLQKSLSAKRSNDREILSV